MLLTDNHKNAILQLLIGAKTTEELKNKIMQYEDNPFIELSESC